jgi:hypothetical protein
MLIDRQQNYDSRAWLIGCPERFLLRLRSLRDSLSLNASAGGGIFYFV